MVGRLLKACLDRGIEPILGVDTKKLVRVGDRITGIEGTRDGEPFELSARSGVIITTGGFEWDAEARQTFLRGPAPAPASPPTANGDGLKLAMQAGAKLGNMTSAWWTPTLPMPESPWPDGEPRTSPMLLERTLPIFASDPGESTQWAMAQRMLAEGYLADGKLAKAMMLISQLQLFLGNL